MTNFLQRGIDSLKVDDVHDFMLLKEEHDEKFIEWCKTYTYAGPDDQLDSDIQWVGKALKFLVERGYLTINILL